ncbi:hypothetical protein [Kitasatospora phosalacinea]|uniref:Uncharacterized protein n=1 Tax=Kitasatospora phosalacinea TaxID=2065 RepID=A0ABW6GMK1_9ACTN
MKRSVGAAALTADPAPAAAAHGWSRERPRAAADEHRATGTVVGVTDVTGGYQEGGDTADTSCSSYSGARVRALHQQASGSP